MGESKSIVSLVCKSGGGRLSLICLVDLGVDSVELVAFALI